MFDSVGLDNITGLAFLRKAGGKQIGLIVQGDPMYYAASVSSQND